MRITKNKHLSGSACSSDINDLIEEFRTALLDEINQNKIISSHGLALKNGFLLFSGIDRYIYRFPLPESGKLESGIPFHFEFRNSRYDGQIVAADDDTVDIELDADLGKNNIELRIFPDKSKISEILCKKLKAVQTGETEISPFNEKGCRKLFGILPTAKLPKYTISDSLGNGEYQPNAYQKDAILRSLTQDVTYIWGPPGTGKTQTLSAILQSLVSSGKKVLLTSHTNLAVDEILSKFIKDTSNRKLIGDGFVLRYGTPSKNDPGLDELILENITLRKSKKHQELIRQINEKILPIKRQLEMISGEKISKDFESLYTFQVGIQTEEKAIDNDQKRLEQLIKSEEELKNRINTNSRKINEYNNSGILKRKLSGINIEKLSEERENLENQITDAFSLKNKLNSTLESHQDNLQVLKNKVNNQEDTILREFSKYGISIEKPINLEKLREIKGSLRKEILRGEAEIEEQQEIIAQIRDSIILNASVVGCTLSKYFMDNRLQTANFDTLILDEASMAPLPAVFYVAGCIPNEHYIISGDFCQLSPISECSTEMGKKWLLRNIFEEAGIVESIAGGDSDERLVMLREQYRMHPNIVALINGPMYHGQLVTPDKVTDQKEKIAGRPPFEGKATVLIDSSSLHPWSKKPGKSKINIYHAVIASELTKKILDGGTASVGIITPYRAQSELISSYLKKANIPPEKAMAATVHKFQGNEREWIIFDTVESEGTYNRFMKGQWQDSEAGRLLNVAISRAEGKFILIGNNSYISKKFAKDDAIMMLLKEIESSGNCISARDILPNFTFDATQEIKGVDLITPRLEEECALFDEITFYNAFVSAVNQAQNVVVIFSPFIRKIRMGYLMDTFRAALGRGVRIVCITREPSEQGSMDLRADTIHLVEECRKVGLEMLSPDSIRTIPKMFHEKIAFIDNSVVFYGSLNILSQSNSSETMMAFRDESTVEELHKMFMVDSLLTNMKSQLNKNQTICENNNNRGSIENSKKSMDKKLRSEQYGKSVTEIHKSKPEEVILQKNGILCSKCGNSTSLLYTKNHFVVVCSGKENNCGYKEELNFEKVKELVYTAKITCPECGRGNMTLRDGKYGPFMGCSNFPNCRNTMKFPSRLRE